MTKKKQEGELRAKEGAVTDNVVTGDTRQEQLDANREEITNAQNSDEDQVNLVEKVQEVVDEHRHADLLPEDQKDRHLTQMTQEIIAQIPDERGDVEERVLDDKPVEVRVCGGEPPVIDTTLITAGDKGYIVDPDSQTAADIQQRAIIESGIGNDQRVLEEEQIKDVKDGE